MTTETLICDIEIYRNFLLIAFKRVGDGRVRTFEMSDRSTFDRELVRRIMLQNRIVTFNGQGFDIPLIFYALAGASVADIKLACDRIINGRVRYWDIENLLGVAVPRIDHVDLIEPQPNAFASLKTLNGRLHGPKMQDLPYPPDAVLTHEQMDEVTLYCGNDLDATERLFNALAEPIALRERLGERYGLDLRSKSDAQMAEAIVKRRVEKLTGRRVERVETPAGFAFKYPVPEYITFRRPDLVETLDRIRETTFIVGDDGKADLPQWLGKKQITIGETTYAMGIGGLHSTEKNRSVHSDWAHFLRDSDVRGYYPEIILQLGLYPRSLGPKFLEVYRDFKTERDTAKGKAAKLRKLIDVAIAAKQAELREQLAVAESEDQGGKIGSNGIFGKTGNKYAIVHAPHLLISVTLTGQLALLMLIEWAEAAGIPVVSANTDGLVFRCPRHLERTLNDITEKWERVTGFSMEHTEYRSVYSLSVNTYIAVKPYGKVKRKGKLMNPHRETMRDQLMHNPNMGVCSDAVVALLVDGTPIEETIRACTDIRDFVTVVNVKGGAVWRGEYLGKVVRFIWSKDGAEILYKDPHPSTGNFKKVSLTDGCRPLMDLPDALPVDLDYERYFEAAREILIDIGYTRRPLEIKKPRVLKAQRLHWLALAVAT